MYSIAYKQRSKKLSRFFMQSYASSYFTLQVFNVGSLFITSFVIFLGFSDSQIGFLASIPAIVNSTQVFAPMLYNKLKKRKQIICVLISLKYVMLYSIILIPIIIPKQYQILAFFMTMFLVYTNTMLVTNALTEWNSFFVPTEIQGSYFSNRNLLTNLISMISSVIIGKLLDHYDSQLYGYFIIMMGVLIFAVFEITSLLRIDEYNEDLLEKENLSLKKMVLIPLKDKRYLSYILFCLIFRFACSLTDPYINIYSLKYIKLEYYYLSIIGSITALFKVLLAKRWGKYFDKTGWTKALKFSGIGYAITYIILIFIGSNNTFYLYPIFSILRGVFMIGSNIILFNITLLFSDKDNKMIYWSIQGMIISIFSFVGPNLSGIIVKSISSNKINIFSMQLNGYQLMFFITSVLILGSTLIFTRKKQETSQI
ncbi:MFS transporter [Clostridium grantii]|uniref:Major Facilitator Superfamily protein n=1 Tax=Clostridium grantii DSM 8605 TaxID=1121316 RepID=A0A1M5T4H7_9CLOT|nr:MFS transporter [Clostridium grantii]SHH45661.1 Major Facilitator Superfamily protein [Clostridium grantii DSM 8605]